MSDLPPLLFTPVYKDYVWGGRWIPDTWPRRAPEGKIAESWEVSAHPDGMSVVEGGRFAGRTLESLTAELGAELVGGHWPGGRFPVLVKLIDAEQTLSVQVHPDNARAAQCGGEAKSEMWVILDAAPGACVYCGFNEPVLPDELGRAAAEDPSWLEGALRKIPVSAGDVINVPGGRVHAIGAGCRLLEVQQNSNTTYRLYDWGRVGADGAPRELHLDQAARVANLEDDAASVVVPEPMDAEGGTLTERELLHTDYFAVDEFHFTRRFERVAWVDSFEAWFARRGGVHLEGDFGEFEVPEGRTVFLPAGMGDCTVTPANSCEVLCISLPPL